MDEIKLRVWERRITHMVFYFRSWHWSCCWLLLLIACCLCLLDDCWLRLGYCCCCCCWLLLMATAWILVMYDCCSRLGYCCCCWLLLMATAWILVMDDCWSRLGYYLLIDCWRKSLWTLISKKRWGNLAKTLFKNVLEYFRWEAIGIWRRHYLKMS